MNYLLDTHAFLWAAFLPSKLSAKARNEIRSAENQVCISSVSFWEISLKYTLGKIELSNCTPADMPDIATQMGLEIIQLGAQGTVGVDKVFSKQKTAKPHVRFGEGGQARACSLLCLHILRFYLITPHAMRAPPPPSGAG